MKEIKCYICEICGTEYKDMMRAQECEENHHKPESIVKTKYLPYSNNKTGMPVSIDVKMSNGKIITYKR